MSDIDDDLESQDALSDDDASGETPQYSTEREKLLAEWWEIQEWSGVDLWSRTLYIADNGKPVSLDTLWNLTHKTQEAVVGPNVRIIHLEPKNGAATKLEQMFRQIPELVPHKTEFFGRERRAARVLRKLNKLDNRFAGHTLLESPPPETDPYLLDLLVPSESLTVLYAPAAIGKSKWAQKLSVCVADPAMAFDDMPVTHGKVLYITLDGGAAWKEVRKRLIKIHAHLQLPLNANLVVADDQFHLDKIEDVEALLDKHPGRWALIVVDSLYGALSNHDPKSAKHVNQAFENIQHTIIPETGAAVIVIHHTGRDDSHPYGTAFIEAGASSILHMRAGKRDGDIVLDVEKQKNDERFDETLIYRDNGGWFSNVTDTKAIGIIDAADTVTRGDMLELMPTKPTPIRQARALIEELLRASTPRAKEQEWLRIRSAWVDAKVAKQVDGKIWRVS